MIAARGLVILEMHGMAEYVSTYTTGFGGVIARHLPRALPGARVTGVYDGLIQYQYEGSFEAIRRVMCLNNTYYVLRTYRGKDLTFERMVAQAGGVKRGMPINAGTFRVRFSRENKFEKVDNAVMSLAQAHVMARSRLTLDRLNPSTEIWYIIRSEGVGFYCQLLNKREATEKTLNRGELRPELAHLMCLCAELKGGETVCDPFCGYGAIPMRLASDFNPRKLLASDTNERLINALRARAPMRGKNISLTAADATKLAHIPDYAIDAIITDPPWGYYEEIADMYEFYTRVLNEFTRILKPNGVMVILSARKPEFKRACDTNKLAIHTQIDTLVNGKKAAVFIARPQPSE